MDISIIIPLYKGDMFIEKRKANIYRNFQYIRKFHPIEMELIFVDDNGTANGEDFISDMDGMTIRMIHNSQNMGIHYSRVAGLEHSTGQFIVFLDQDDDVNEEYMNSQMQAIGDADAVVCNGIYRDNRMIIADGQMEKNILESDYFATMDGFISPGQVLIRKTAIPDAWKKYILHNNYCDDVLLWLLMKENNAVFRVNREIMYYHNENGMNTSFQWKHNAEALMEMYETIHTNQLLNKTHDDILKECIERKVHKHLQYALLEEDLRWAEQHLELIGKYFSDNHFKRIAIYGWGVFGKKFFDLAINAGIDVAYAIDKNAEAFHSDLIDVKGMQEPWEPVDAVVVTAVFAYESIKNMLVSRNVSHVVSMDQLLKEANCRECQTENIGR